MIKDFTSFGFWGQRYDFFSKMPYHFLTNICHFLTKSPKRGNMAYCFRSVAL